MASRFVVDRCVVDRFVVDRFVADRLVTDRIANTDCGRQIWWLQFGVLQFRL